MTPALALTYWQRALTCEFGLALPIPGGPPALRKAQTILYAARKAAGDAELQRLMLVLPNGGREIWLIKKEVELEE